MPLPPALLQRLAERGIVGNNDGHKREKRPKLDPQHRQDHMREEIIAEDYDDVEEPYPYDYEPIKKPQENYWSERLKRRITDGSVIGYKGCPNKYNIFHKCSLYCINTYGDGITEPSRDYVKRKQRLLKYYPLPNDWKDVYDCGSGVHYYWNTKDDTVSWLPPAHPKAAITKSAASLRRELEALLPEQEDDEYITKNINNSTVELPSLMQQEILPPEDSEYRKSIPVMRKQKTRDLEKALRAKTDRRRHHYKRSDPEKNDPMDPASYSNVPRGKWSAGLEGTENNRLRSVSPEKSGKMKRSNRPDDDRSD